MISVIWQACQQDVEGWRVLTGHAKGSIGLARKLAAGLTVAHAQLCFAVAVLLPDRRKYTTADTVAACKLEVLV